MVSLQKMGQVRLAAGDNDSAYVAYEEGLAIARRLVDAAPNDSGAQYDLSVALQGTGLAKSRAGKREAALSDLEGGSASPAGLSRPTPAIPWHSVVFL